MADVKTNLRELSVAIGVRSSVSGEFKIDTIKNSDEFIEKCTLFIDNDISSANNIRGIDISSPEYSTIIHNGSKLSQLITKKLPIKKTDKIIWVGNDTQKDDPVDLIVGDYNFSLKEESFILENMGLYKYLNIMTGSNYSRSLHVFKTFAKDEYEKWFEYTFNKLKENPKWKKENKEKKYFSEISLIGDNIVLNYNNKEKSSLPLTLNSTDKYMKLTTAITREKVFAKWIEDTLKNNSEYLKLKKQCSEVAGKTITDYVNKHLNADNITRLLQIRDKPYYYCKTTQNETTLLYVPGKKDYLEEFQVKYVTYGVPCSQLNIYTTIRNRKTNKEITMRNECRFSHGQFNGTPEAKMYYSNKSGLDAIYREL